MLRAFGRRMLEFVKGCLEIFWHGYVAGACGMVPVNCESVEEVTGPVDGDGVEFLEGLDEVVSVIFADVLDPKVIYDEGLVVCIHSAGVLGTGAKPKWARWDLSRSLAMWPSCLRTGMPFRISR